MRRMDQATAIVMLALAGLIAVATSDLAAWSGFTPGARFMPLVISLIAAVLSVVQLVSATRHPAAAPVDWPRGGDARRVVLVIGAILLFAGASAWIGIVTAAFLVTLGLLALVLGQPPLPSLFTAAVIAAIIWGVFVAWLGLRLPTGPLGF
jgi:hypothetical protein